MTPFIPGVNYMPDIDDDLKNLTEKQAIENANVQSKQRAIERTIRSTKERLHVAEVMNNDELTSKYKTRLTEQKRALKSYVDKYPFLYRDRQRERYYDDPLAKTREAIRQRDMLAKKHA